MPRKKPQTVAQGEQKKLITDLCQTIAALKDEKQVKRFLTDLLSDTEMLMLARRIRIARLLLEGHSYEEIADLLGASPNTVAQVHRWLQKDTNDLKKLEKQLAPMLSEKSRRNIDHIYKEHPKPGTMAWMRERYPMHFLFFNLLSGK